MVATGVSEFTYSFAFLHEHVINNWNGLRGVPILPSLQQEAQLGWDVEIPQIGVSFFYQFKMCKYFERKNAMFFRDGTYVLPYFRIDLHKRNKADLNEQHHRLWLHGQTNPETYYAAPEIRSQGEFNTAFLNRDVIASSKLIKLEDCPDYHDDVQHRISWQPGTQALFHSEKKVIDYAPSGKEIGEVYSKSQSKSEPINREYSRHLLDNVKTFSKEIVEKDTLFTQQEFDLIDTELPANAEPKRILKLVSALAQTYVGAQLVIVGEGE